MVGVSRLADRFSLGRVRMDNGGERAEADFGSQGQRNFINHLPSVASDDSSTEDLVGSSFDMDFDESFFLTIGNSSVHLPHGNGKRVDVNSLFLGVVFVHTNVSNLRVSIRTPGNGEGTEFFASEE